LPPGKPMTHRRRKSLRRFSGTWRRYRKITRARSTGIVRHLPSRDSMRFSTRSEHGFTLPSTKPPRRAGQGA
jgi:hypothetical protein